MTLSQGALVQSQAQRKASVQELAWASFALLKNINIDGLLIISGSKVLMGRGEFCEGTRLEEDFAKQVGVLRKMGGVDKLQSNAAKQEPAQGVASLFSESKL